MEIKHITTPLEDSVIEHLKSGEKVLLTGFIYTARDTAHKRFIDVLNEGGSLPFAIEGEIIYYCGPSPAPPGKIVGACGPTTSSRMDLYAPRLISLGLKGMIGKGKRGMPVKEAIKKYKAVYFGATGGAGALLSKCVVSASTVAYADLGPEAVVKLGVKDMPLFVINDIYGNDLYQAGMEKYAK
jgi:fumarate hydratase subunit beta